MGKLTFAVSASPRRVLVVDDEANLTFLLEALLKTEGWRGVRPGSQAQPPPRRGTHRHGERAHPLGGRVRVISAPREGTQVIAQFPLNESGAESLRRGTGAPPLRAHLGDFSRGLAR